ncbi:DsrE family protein [Thermoproteota archaeon]
MSGKILFMIISGTEDINKARWGLRMALNTFTHPYGDKLIDEVRVLLFCDGVKLVDPSHRYYSEVKERLSDLVNAGVEVASCISIAEPLGLVDESNSLGIECVHASAYVANCVHDGFNTLSF